MASRTLPGLKISGDRELLKALRKLADPKAQVRVARSAANFAMTPTLKAAKLNANSTTLAKALAKQSRTKGSTVRVAIGPRRDKEKDLKSITLSALSIIEEFGAAPHTISAPPGSRLRLGDSTARPASVLHPGVPPRRYMTRAFQATKNEVIKRFAEKAWRQIRKEAEKQAAK